MNKLLKNKKGVLMFYIIFIMMAIFIVFIASVLAPMGVKINTKLYAAGEKLMLDAQDDLNLIQNATIRNTLDTTIDNALANVENNIELNANLFRYSWIFVIGISALMLFLLARVLVETQGRGGIVI